MKLVFLGAAAALLLAVWAAPGRANDTMAEIALGGLVLKNSDAIALDQEDLFLSVDEVRVDYLFTNTGSEDIEALVAFPLPDQMFDDFNEFVRDFRTELDFRTTVDGEPVDYDITVQAIVNGRDVTSDLSVLGLEPYSPANWDDYDAAIKALTQNQLDDAVERGFLERDTATEEATTYLPRWKIRTAVTRSQLFPAGQTIAVSHRYKPVSGGSVGGGLDRQYRNGEYAREHAAEFCIEDGWFAAFDKALAKRATAANPSPYTELWLGYVLSTGANWKGPTGEFRMVVDKGKPENLISFCADGVEKISPTQFEIRKTDFEPEGDIKIMIVDWYKPAE
jgi:hypothetical protein